jgi:transcriptional regulator with XRE-family HTH domain
LLKASRKIPLRGSARYDSRGAASVIEEVSETAGNEEYREGGFGSVEAEQGREDLELGRKIRDLRQLRKLGVGELARRVGVSRSLISQIERGVASPSLTTLRGIAEVLGVPVAALFLGSDDASGGESDRQGRRLVVRAHERKRLHSSHANVSYELLTPDVDRKIEFVAAEVEPGTSVPAEEGIFVAHQGEENVLCERGSVTFIIAGEEFHLGPGDSISFDCSVPHRMENRGDTTARLVCAVTPPSF